MFFKPFEIQIPCQQRCWNGNQRKGQEIDSSPIHHRRPLLPLPPTKPFRRAVGLLCYAPPRAGCGKKSQEAERIDVRNSLTQGLLMGLHGPLGHGGGVPGCLVAEARNKYGSKPWSMQSCRDSLGRRYSLNYERPILQVWLPSKWWWHWEIR